MNKNKNYHNAWKHFYPEGNGKNKPGYCLHHINPEWKHNDIQRYNEWRIEDLQMMTNEEHSRLHGKIRGRLPKYELTDEIRRKISEGVRKANEEGRGMKGSSHSEATRKLLSEHNWLKGKHQSEEAKEHLRSLMKGMTSPMKGKHHSEETKAKMSASQKGKKITEEVKEKLSQMFIGIQRGGGRQGMVYWNNGEKNKRAIECPGTEWKRGKLRK